MIMTKPGINVTKVSNVVCVRILYHANNPAWIEMKTERHLTDNLMHKMCQL